MTNTGDALFFSLIIGGLCIMAAGGYVLGYPETCGYTLVVTGVLCLLVGIRKA